MSFELEKNVPLEKFVSTKAKYPLNKMEVDDSFVMPLSDRNSLMSLIAQNRMKGSKAKYATRKISELEVRVWRIK